MDLSIYQAKAERTDLKQVDNERLVEYGRLLNAAIGVAGEAGEMLDEVKKVVYHGHELDKDKVCKELGDCLWYLAKTAREIDITLNLVAEENIKKLEKRYPEGFEVEKSVYREDYYITGGNCTLCKETADAESSIGPLCYDCMTLLVNSLKSAETPKKKED